MKNLLRRILYSTLFRLGSVRTVLLGPCRGLKYRIFPDYGLGYFFGHWEPEEMKAAATHLRPGAIAYDLGANYGMYTLFLARLVGASGKVFAFEPLPGNVAELTANVNLNGFNNVEIVPKAAAGASGSLLFELGQTANAGHLIEQGNANNSSRVPAVSLDDFVIREGKAPPDFIKMDVEGAEGDVLNGAQEIVSRYRPVMLIELHNPNADLAVGTFLKKFGYSAFRIQTGEKVEELDSPWPNPRGIWGRVVALPGSAAREAA